MRIEAATLDDAEVIAELNVAIHDPHCQLAPDYFRSESLADVVAEFKELLAASDTHTLIAWEESAPVGYCLLKIVEREPNAWTIGFRRLLVDQLRRTAVATAERRHRADGSRTRVRTRPGNRRSDAGILVEQRRGAGLL